MNAGRMVGQDEPLMIAWNAYKATEEDANSRQWAEYKAHLDGSLWAAFCAGYAACDDELRKQEPVGYWHVAEDKDECDFRLGTDISGDCPDCLPLYAAPIPTVTPTTAVKEVWLCYAYGETEWPCVVIASNREQIRQFVIDEWLGDSDDEQLPEIMERIDAYDWKDGTLEWRFEIGGVKISKVYNAAPIPPDNHDWKAEYLRQVDLHNQTLDELREAEMQLRNPAPTPPTPSQQEIKGLVSVLRGGRQCDEDGCEIIMSRQACCEAADYLESFILARPDEVTK